MNQLQMAIAVMAACDIGGGSRDAEGRRRQYTAAELDALVDFHWPWSGVMGRLAAGVAAIRSSAFRHASDRRKPVALPVVEAAPQV
jgi:hypothetical protein